MAMYNSYTHRDAACQNYVISKGQQFASVTNVVIICHASRQVYMMAYKDLKAFDVHVTSKLPVASYVVWHLEQ